MPGLHIWLFVRAQVDGARWYASPREIAPMDDGSWRAEVQLGGPPNIRHELHLGTLGDVDHAALVRWLAAHRDQPLDDLPGDFSEEVERTVLRN